MWREQSICKELVHILVVIGKSEIYRENQESKDSGRVFCCCNFEVGIILLKEVSVFAFKDFNKLGNMCPPSGESSV